MTIKLHWELTLRRAKVSKSSRVQGLVQLDRIGIINPIHFFGWSTNPTKKNSNLSTPGRLTQLLS
jgi:hypothetical protein